tara:strand:+ start:5143 stop:5451 length:309 start_codon:yes stop_codon:yes gene_type:complete
MKKIHTEKTIHGTIDYYQDAQGNVTTAKPVDGVIFTKILVSDDPSQYALGKEFDDAERAIAYVVSMQDFRDLYIIELSYINDDLPPQYIHVVNTDGTKTRIM